MAVDGVVADEEHRSVRDAVPKEEPGQGDPELEPRPGGAGQDAPVGGAMGGGEPARGAEQVGDGVPAGGEGGGGRQDEEASEGRPGEGGGEPDERREGVQG
jgi:hypothetical protein